MTTSISSEAQQIMEWTNRQSELEGRYTKREKMQKLKKKSRNP